MKLFILMSLLVSSHAFAQSCQTNSNGYPFEHSSRSEDFSRRKVLASCQASSMTNNDECAVNLMCDSDPRRELITCDNSSNGYTFSHASLDKEFSERRAISKCQASSMTNNEECQINLRCDDGMRYPKFVSCNTSSNGYSFSKATRDAEYSAARAIKACQASSMTNNEECEINLECER